MIQYNYKCDSYDPHVFPSFTGYVITQSQLLFVERNYVVDQWDLNPTGNDTNALIKAAREEADLPRNAKIYIDDSEFIDLNFVSDYGYIAGDFSDDEDDEDEEAEGWNDIVEHFADF